MPATASQEQRSSRVIVVLSIRCASHATTSSKSRVNRASGRAHGTVSVRTRPHAPAVQAADLGLQEQPSGAQIQVPPAARRPVIDRAGRPAARAGQPPGTTAHVDHDPRRGERHTDHVGTGDGEHLVECGSGAHASLQGRFRFAWQLRNLRGRRVRVLQPGRRPHQRPTDQALPLGIRKRSPTESRGVPVFACRRHRFADPTKDFLLERLADDLASISRQSRYRVRRGALRVLHQTWADSSRLISPSGIYGPPRRIRPG